MFTTLSTIVSEPSVASVCASTNVTSTWSDNIVASMNMLSWNVRLDVAVAVAF